ncbi:hypothetical protein G7Y79_00010g027870 [Physcia stellaris]|nr:hypothetical protein G7Y79_00010g027870 [Physcia stellaris]
MSHVNGHPNSSSAVPISRKRRRSASVNGELPNDKLDTSSKGLNLRKRRRNETVSSELHKYSPSPPATALASGDLHYSASIEAFLDKCYPEITHPPPSTWHSSTRHPPSFYDCLSKIHLTSGALHELNRRNRHLPKSAAIALGPDSGIDFDSLPLRRGEVSANLQRFARVGGPDLIDLRGYIRSESIDLETSETSTSESLDMAGKKRKSKSQSGPSSNKRTTKSGKSVNTGPYDDNFMTALLDGGVDGPHYDPKPANFEALKTLMKATGSSPRSDFTEAKLAEFREAAQKAANEEGVNLEVITKIRDNTAYETIHSKLCSNWAPLLEEGGLTAAKPDYMDGLKIKKENAFLRLYLDTYIVPAANAPFLPNFFFEAKGPMGLGEVAQRQALHDGALGARGILYTRICAGRKIDDNAYTFSGFFAGGVVKLFAHFITQPDGIEGMLHYHMCIIGQWIVESDLDTYRVAVTAFRNLRRHASTVRERIATSAIDVLHSQVRSGKLNADSTYTPTHAPQTLDFGPASDGSRGSRGSAR